MNDMKRLSSACKKRKRLFAKANKFQAKGHVIEMDYNRALEREGTVNKKKISVQSHLLWTLWGYYWAKFNTRKTKGEKLWAEAVLQERGPKTMIKWAHDSDDGKCTLSTGEVFE